MLGFRIRHISTTFNFTIISFNISVLLSTFLVKKISIIYVVYKKHIALNHMMSGSKQVGVETYFIVFQTQPIVGVYL